MSAGIGPTPVADVPDLASTLRVATRPAPSVVRGFALYSLTFRIVGIVAALSFELVWLAVIQALGATVYGLSFVRARRVSIDEFLAFLGPEWVLWGVAMVVAFGGGPFFHVHSIVSTAAILLLLHELPIRRRFLMFGLPLVLPIPFLLLLRKTAPAIELAPATVETLAAVQQITAVAVVVVVSALAMLDHARARELAEQRAEEQTRLVEDLSHELRTPIAAMLTAAQGARTVQDSSRTSDEKLERIGERLQWIESSARASGRLVERMLELAMLDRGPPTKRHTVPLESALAAITDRLRPLAAERDRELRFRAGTSSERPVDGASLEIVLRNLVVNALAHSPEGGRIEVRLVERDGRDRVDVEDQGEGIAPEDVPRLFDRMWRADRARSRKEGRYGLGLAIAQRHAALLGAEIEVRSEVGRGSVFSLVFR